MRTGPLTYNAAYELLRATGYEPVPGSSRFENAEGETGRIVDAPGRGDSWYVETVESFEANAASGSFSTGFAQGRRDRESGHIHQLCTTGTGERPPVVKRHDRDYYHGYKAAAEGATSEPAAYLAYRAKHRGMSGMAANASSRIEKLGNVIGGSRRLGSCPACGAQHMSTHDEIVPIGHQNFCVPCGEIALMDEQMEENPVHLQLDGNFSFGVGTKDDEHMRRNSRASTYALQAAPDDYVVRGAPGGYYVERVTGSHGRTVESLSGTRGHESLREALDAAADNAAHYGIQSSIVFYDAPDGDLRQLGSVTHGRFTPGGTETVEDIERWIGKLAGISRPDGHEPNARKNITSVIKAFREKRSKREDTCHTDGDTIWSYGLPIASRIRGEVFVLDPKESPSRTTTGQIRAVLAEFPDSNQVPYLRAVPGYGEIDAHRANARQVGVRAGHPHESHVLGETESGKSVVEPLGGPYQLRFKVPHWNVEPTVLMMDPPLPPRVLAEAFSGWSKKDHAEAAEIMAVASDEAAEEWDKIVASAIRKYGDGSGSAVSGIYREHFPEETKEVLRYLSRLKTDTASAAYLHFRASGSRARWNESKMCPARIRS